jgi:hypothetical protein
VSGQATWFERSRLAHTFCGCAFVCLTPFPAARLQPLLALLSDTN